MTQEEAVAAASMWVATPGSSEHEIGLAVDLISLEYPILEEAQEQTKEQQWLMANAHRFGFILRYPVDKTQITGIGYEPWHYRYVGKEAAQEIYERGCTLEEYLGLVE
jgi:D-alanyl-D-alanine carboxypeptidase